MKEKKEKDNEKMMEANQICFGQRCEEVAITTKGGFFILDCGSGNIVYEAQFPSGGPNCIAILSDSNLVACSGDDSSSGFSKKCIILWDKPQHKVLFLYEVKYPVSSLIFRADILIVANGDLISFFDTCGFQLINEIKTPIQSAHPVSIVQSLTSCLIAIPSEDGSKLDICHYHDPKYVLGSIPIPFSKINFFSFDRRGDLLAIVTDEARIVQLWDVHNLRLIATYKRGMRPTVITSIAFDSLSSNFIMTTHRGTVHVFTVPTPKERKTLSATKELRSKFSYEMKKNTNFFCQFEEAGYQIVGITNTQKFILLGMDLENGTVEQVMEKDIL